MNGFCFHIHCVATLLGDREFINKTVAFQHNCTYFNVFTEVCLSWFLRDHKLDTACYWGTYYGFKHDRIFVFQFSHHVLHPSPDYISGFIQCSKMIFIIL